MTEPRTFKDKTGDEWSLEITVKTAMDAKAQLGVDISSLNEELLTRLSEDAELLGSLLFLTCEKQIDHRGLDADTFFERFDGDTVEQAGNAWFEALIDFFPQQRREALRTMKDRLDGLDERLASKASHLMTENLDEFLNKMETGADGADGSSGAWHLIDECVAILSIDPAPYSLRRLVAMVEKKQRVEWDRTASLMTLIANVNRGARSKAFGIHDFHPYIERPKASVDILRQFLPDKSKA